MAKLYFKYGSMNSGKSIELLKTAHNYDEIGKKILVVKPKKDTKGMDSISSRIGLERKTDILLKDDEFLSGHKCDCDCILVDEAELLSKKQIDDLYFITKGFDIPIICYGLRLNYKGESFECSRRLLEIADSLEEIKSLCSCGNIARFCGRKVDGKYTLDGEEVIIDGSDNHVQYVPMCGTCFFKQVKNIDINDYLNK